MGRHRGRREKKRRREKGGEMREGRQVCINMHVLVNSYEPNIQKAGAGEFQVQGRGGGAI